MSIVRKKLLLNYNMFKVERFNEALRKEVALAIARELELPNALLTVTYVISSKDEHYAKVGISVLPFSLAGTALKQLRKKQKVIMAAAHKKIRIRRLPKVIWALDNTENEAAKIEAEISRDEAEIENYVG